MKNKKKKILILGMYDSTYIVHFIFDVLIPLNFEVYIWAETKKINNVIEKNKNVHIVSIEKKSFIFSFFRKLTKRDYFYSLIKVLILKCIPDIDLIHIQFVRSLYIKEAKLIANKNTKIVCSYWGSDILRADKEELERVKKLLKNISYISGDSKVTEAKFNELYPTFKYNLIYYGDSICDEIIKLNNDNYKEEFNLDKEKKSIAVGYNARMAQQHIKVLEEIVKLPKEIKNKVQFVFQINYCIDDLVYLDNLKLQLSKSDIDYVLIDYYMDDKQVAKLRKSVDIFINSQTTDAFCNTVKEYFLLGKIVINPEWLKYEEIKDWNLKIIEYKKFSELPIIISNIIKNYKTEDFKINSKIMTNKVSWIDCKNKWDEIYKELF